jgi:transposase InsO family protein
MSALTRQATKQEKESSTKRMMLNKYGMEEEEGEIGDVVTMADGKMLRIRESRMEMEENEEAVSEVDKFEQMLDEFERGEGEAEREVVNHVALGQSDDEALSAIIAKVSRKGKTVIITDSSWYAFYKSNKPYLFVSSRNVLYIKPRRSNRYKVFVPESIVTFLMLDTHEGMGHPSVERMMGLLEPYVYWRQMRNSLKLHVRRCMICATRQGQGQMHRAPMTSIQVEAVKFGRVFADVVKLGESRTGFKYILTVVDNFTKWVECYPMRTQSAQETAYWMKQYLTRWDMVRSLLTDNGANFKAEIFEVMLKESGVRHLYTSPYWPQGDGLSERTHRTILNMLSKHCLKSRIDWCEKLQEVVMWHNKMPNKSTGQVPFTLVHCYPPTVVPGSPYLRVANLTVHEGAVEDEELRPQNDLFEAAREEAVQCLEAASLLRKVYYDKTHKTKVVLVAGQRVFRMYPPAKKGRIYKLSRVYCGPFRLLQVRENGSALIKRVDKMELPPVRVNVGHLTHCYGEVPTNKFWNGSTLVIFRENELSGKEDIEIKEEWLKNEKDEKDEEVIEHKQY